MTELQEKIADYVSSLFVYNEGPNLVYHNISHTRQVVKHTVEIINHYQLDDNCKFAVWTAAWFHDVGYMFSTTRDHEETGVKIMRRYLGFLEVNSEIIEAIAKCIMATKIPSQPTSLIEQILCDADTYHLGTKDFLISDKLVKKEMFIREGIQAIDWDRQTLNFLQQHQFFTDYCQQKLNPGKSINIAVFQKRIDKGK